MHQKRCGLFRSKCSTQKFKQHGRLRTLFVVFVCSIFIFVLFSELYIGKHEEHVYVYQYQKQYLKGRSFFYAIRNQLFQHLDDENSLGIQSSESDHEEFHKFLLESRQSNKTFFFFNNTKTFQKLLDAWFESRSSSQSLNLSFQLNHKHACVDQGERLSVLIAVTSSATHLESRAAIRDTWGGFAKERGAQVVFFLGLPKNSKYHSRISHENKKFKDIVQADFLDTYSNLTLKTISVLKWVTEGCSLVKYVLKVDDDMFINIDNFLNFTEGSNESKTIMGELAHEWPPVRSKKNKWYTSFSEYPFSIYPDFVFGPSYLLTGDAIQVLYEESLKMKHFQLEDVFITGFVAEKAGIKRKNLPSMFNTPRDLQPCNYKHLLSSHGHTPPDMRRHWMWLTRRNFKCVSQEHILNEETPKEEFPQTN